jgi:ATP-binding cassette subfamily B protein
MIGAITSRFDDRRKPRRTLLAPGVKPAPIEHDGEQRYRPITMALVRRLLTSLAPYKWLYVTAISLGLCHVMLDMLGPRFVGKIINYATDYAAGRIPGISRSQAQWHEAGIVGMWAIAFVGSVILQRYTILFMTRAGESVQFTIRRRIFGKLQELSMSYYDRTKLGRIISRCTSDIDSLREVNVWGIWQVVANASMMLVAAGYLVFTDWKLFLSVAWLGVVLFIANRIYLSKAKVWSQITREGFTRVSTNLAENITGVRVVTAFNRQDPNLSVFNRLQEDNTANNVTNARINAVYQPTLLVIQFAGRITILLYGGYLFATGRLLDKGVGTVVSVFMYWDWFMNPIINFGNFYTQLITAMAGAERVFALLDTQPDVFDLADAKPLPRIEGLVKFEDVTFGYNPDRPVLHGINFEAHPGQMVALVGATGSGKSSIISLIARFYQPQQGRVLVDGHDLRYTTGESLHKQMGLVLQVNYLFSGTVMENIRYAKPDACEADVIAAAKAIGSYEAIMSLVKGFESEVGERGASMSLGQRQLICFTRAFLADPRIFMLDEATSAVDTATEMEVQHSLEKLLSGRTTFVVAHRLSTVMRADCIFVVDAGKIIERGTHRELVAAGGKYAHLYRQFVSHSE